MIDSGNNADGIFTDFAKAIDKVPHVRLGHKLESHCIFMNGLFIGYQVESRGFVLMESYLSGNSF